MEVQPGEGVGVFKLGMTLWDFINLLRSTSVRQLGTLTQCTISWSAEGPNSSYIVINILFGPATAYRLIYSGVQQRLVLIEVLPPAISTVITWKGQALFPAPSSTSKEGAAFLLNPQRAINSKFGPTYPPSAHPSFPEEVILSYPGVVFAFYKDGVTTSKSIGIQNANNIPLSSEAPNLKCPLTRLVVSKHDPSANHATAYPNPSKLVEDQAPYAVAEGDVAYVDIELPEGSEPPCKAIIHLFSLPSTGIIEPVEVVLGHSTAEDIMCTLGPPLRTYYKQDMRLSIHDRSTSSSSMSEVPPNAYFFNYFSLGLDFLFHPETNKVIKVLLHSNSPGEVIFGRYNKCRWRLRKAKETADGVSSEDNINKIKAFFGSSETPDGAAPAPGLRTDRTMLLDRLADSTDGVKLDRSTNLIAYPGCILEITQHGHVETLWIVQ